MWQDNLLQDFSSQPESGIPDVTFINKCIIVVYRIRNIFEWLFVINFKDLSEHVIKYFDTDENCEMALTLIKSRNKFVVLMTGWKLEEITLSEDYI